ncbi:hypothetical protein HDU86_006316 [Geranomyces michiganensis]|nr:hypothetical protein HDU86_006316 [Geranomyces michiganensis]
MTQQSPSGNRGPQPTRLQRFDITVIGPPRLEAAQIDSQQCRPKYSIEAVVTIQVKKLVTASKLQWSFVGKEHARSPLLPLSAKYKCEHIITKSSGKILSQDNLILRPGETYTYPITVTLPPTAVPSFHSQWAGIRYAFTATLHRKLKARPWLLGRPPQIYATECEVHVPKIFVAPAHMQQQQQQQRGPRVYRKLGGSTVAITAPACIVLDANSTVHRRQMQTVAITIDVVAGPAKLKAVDVKLFENIPLADEVWQRPSVAKKSGRPPVNALTPEDLQQRVLIHLDKENTPITPSSTSTVVHVQVPADAYATWRDDVAHSRFFGCRHWFQIELEGKEWLLPVKAGKKEPLVVPVEIHGSMSCFGSTELTPPPLPPPPPPSIGEASAPPYSHGGEAWSSSRKDAPDAQEKSGKVNALNS